MTAKKTTKRSGPTRRPRSFMPVTAAAWHLTQKADELADDLLERHPRARTPSAAAHRFEDHAHLLLIRLDQYMAETNQTGMNAPVHRHVFGPTLDGFRIALAERLAAREISG